MAWCLRGRWCASNDAAQRLDGSNGLQIETLKVYKKMEHSEEWPIVVNDYQYMSVYSGRTEKEETPESFGVLK